MAGTPVPSSRRDVVVVGAGLAGLQAATDLVAVGLDVVVLEARARVGGRVWSRRERFADGQHAESGAELLDAGQPRALELAGALGLQLEPVGEPEGPGRRLLDHAGRVASMAAVDAATGGAVGDDLARWEAACADVAALVDADDPLSAPFAADLDARTAGDLLADLRLQPLARLVAGRRLRSRFHLPPAEVSLLHLARTHRPVVGAARVAGGLDQLATGLARPLRSRVRLGTPVAAVVDRAGGVEVLTVAGDRVAARAVVLALPLPTLSRVDVALPPELFDVGYGVGGTVSVQYSRRLWLDQARDGSVLSDRPYGEVWDATRGAPGDHGVLGVRASSHDGAALLALPDAPARVRRELDRVFPGIEGFAGVTVQQDWGADPWSLGVCAAFGPGQLTRVWTRLREPHGRLVLAGEHTDTLAGTVEGALRSGARAAGLVTTLLA